MRLCVWSGPASLATALMNSFGNRDDTVIVDEPLYAHYLANAPPEIVARHIGVDEILESQHHVAEEVIEKVILADYKKPVVYFKMMPNHLTPKVDLEFLSNAVNVILIRDPKVVASVASKMNQAETASSIRDVSIKDLYLLKQTLISKFHIEPIVIDADDLQENPTSILTQLCTRLGIPFGLKEYSKMLKWPGGPKSYEGVWGKHWYTEAHASTGWNNYKAQPAPLSEENERLAAENMEYYKKMQDSAVRLHLPHKTPAPVQQ